MGVWNPVMTVYQVEWRKPGERVWHRLGYSTFETKKSAEEAALAVAGVGDQEARLVPYRRGKPSQPLKVRRGA